MGIFDFFKKKSPVNKEKTPAVEPKKPIRIEMTISSPTTEDLEAQRKQKAQQKVRNFQKDEAGLYPHEILMLSYLEGYSKGKSVARFWEYEYNVEDVPGLIKSLEERGFAQEGKLTDLGRSEIQNNEYVLYMHRNKFPDISMADMSILVNKHPNMKYRDLIWGELNRLSVQYMSNRQFGLYRNTKYRMYRFLLEEKKYENAFLLLAETIFYDLNGSIHPSIPPALIKDLRNLETKLDYTDEEMIDILQQRFNGMYAPYKNVESDAVICIIVAYALGHDEMAQTVFEKQIAKCL